MNAQVQPPFRKDETLERLLEEVNRLLAPAEETVLARYRMPRWPVVIIVGAPRCGSTLTLQWLAATGRFAYPTNLLSRFYGAPYIGARIQQILTEHDFQGEIFDFNPEVPFTSNLGKTRGALAPHEFWYFWRRFFRATDTHRLAPEEVQHADTARFAAELAALEDAFGKPLAMKGMLLNWNIPDVSRALEKAIFLHVKRHPFYNIQSQLEARVKYFGRREPWHSLKPPEYHWLKDLSPIEQVAGQIYYTVRAVEAGLAQLPPARRLEIRYEDFCAHPEQLFQQLAEKFAQQGCSLAGPYKGPARFKVANRLRLPEADCRAIIAAYRRFSGEEIAP
ncbi:MAG: sulfotransferase [Caldilineae bacterium]|nr:MAG: sulfotransferase [Caldilineae bacterium]